jgi:hypothetical protein
VDLMIDQYRVVRRDFHPMSGAQIG